MFSSQQWQKNFHFSLHTCKCEGDHEITEAYLVATTTREFGRTVPKRTLVASNKLSLLYDECSHDVKNKLVSFVAIDNKAWYFCVTCVPILQSTCNYVLTCQSFTWRTVSRWTRARFIRAITTIVISVTVPHARNTAIVVADKITVRTIIQAGFVVICQMMVISTGASVPATGPKQTQTRAGRTGTRWREGRLEKGMNYLKQDRDDIWFTVHYLAPWYRLKEESMSIIFSSCNHEVYERLGCG